MMPGKREMQPSSASDVSSTWEGEAVEPICSSLGETSAVRLVEDLKGGMWDFHHFGMEREVKRRLC